MCTKVGMLHHFYVNYQHAPNTLSIPSLEEGQICLKFVQSLQIVYIFSLASALQKRDIKTAHMQQPFS